MRQSDEGVTAVFETKPISDSPMPGRSIKRWTLLGGLLAVLGLGAIQAPAQEYVYSVTTVAGEAGVPGSQDGTGVAAQFRAPSSIAIDSAANIFVSDSGNFTIRKIAPGGIVTTLAGTVGVSGNQDGGGTVARFGNPQGIAVDSLGNVYVADAGNNTIRKITKGGKVSTLAGFAGYSGSQDGNGTTARFNAPVGLAIDAANNLYVADTGNHTIRKVTPAGDVSTLAGSAGTAGSDDGTGINAFFSSPTGVAVDSAGNVIVADSGNFTVRVVTPEGAVTTLAGAAGIAGSQDGIGDIARFNVLGGLSVDAAGNVYVADKGNNTIRRVTSQGAVSTVAGSAGNPGSQNGSGTSAGFDGPACLAMDSGDKGYVADSNNNTIRQGVLFELPSIQSQPQSLTNLAGSTAVFTVQARGTGRTYQWQFNGADIANATQSSFTLSNVQTINAGTYTVSISTSLGSVTSEPAVLSVYDVPPTITSSTRVTAQQGAPFTYTLVAPGTAPVTLTVLGLPDGLVFDSTNGVISGVPQVNGIFTLTLGASNSKGSDLRTLTLTLLSSVPVVTSSGNATGTEGRPFTYTIRASNQATSFGASGLPLGLEVNPTNGVISGSSVYGGQFDAVIWAKNAWGAGSNSLHLSFGFAPLTGLAITGVTNVYSKPYLLDLEFSLRDGTNVESQAVVRPPSQLQVRCYENAVPISPTETAFVVGSLKQKPLKAYLLLDYTASMQYGSGDSNTNGVSDAIENMQKAAKSLINQEPAEAQFGVYEFHADFAGPERVSPLTADKLALAQSIDGILTNYVKGNYAGTRCWDAVFAALGEFGAANRDEQRYLVIMSDGNDESSTNANTNGIITAMINLAQTNGVKLYCVAFGNDVNTNALQQLTSQTGGRYYVATTPAELLTQFAQLGKAIDGRYFVRWSTLKRSPDQWQQFQPSFEVTVDGQNAGFNLGVTNIVIRYIDTNAPPVYTTNDPPVIDTNAPPTYITNAPPLIPNFTNALWAGDVRVGALRLLADASFGPRTVTLRTTYAPRYARTVRVHYRANYDCTPILRSTNAGEILNGWTLSETNDGTGGKWLQITSSNPTNQATAMPYGTMGNLVTFVFRDLKTAKQAFSVFEVDNSVYTNLPPTGQSFVMETNTSDFITTYPVTPHGTPVPWLQDNGFSGDMSAAELSDPDKDGVPTWLEYLAGTNPKDKNSAFVIRSFKRINHDAPYQVVFNSVIGRMYRVDVSTDLTNWVTLQDKISGTGSDLTVTDTRDVSKTATQYYRIYLY